MIQNSWEDTEACSVNENMRLVIGGSEIQLISSTKRNKSEHLLKYDFVVGVFENISFAKPAWVRARFVLRGYDISV